MINNIKLIREIYGATQSDIATVLGVSRVTIAKWEKDLENKVSPSVLEKMSLFFGVGPECFYDIEIDEQRTQMIINSSKKAKEIDAKNHTKKEEHFNQLFSSTTFDEATSKYMFGMKMLLALSDEGKVEDLKIVKQINEKMNNRLDAIIKVKEKENGGSISELVEKLSFNIEDN
ncbi:helix-turn-helix transcriptional regulator [Proteiniborus sp.]|uniref:helix-turn-helix transcriptional regulator n=1 Tax=Proteiniborus sp. TaxID=2079015 RepID=UPI00332EEA49